MLDRAEDLESWSLDGVPDGTLKEFPELIEKLKQVSWTYETSGDGFYALFKAPTFKPRTLTVHGLHYNGPPGDPAFTWAALVRYTEVLHLVLARARTSSLVALIPKVDVLELVDPEFDLRVDCAEVGKRILEKAGKVVVSGQTLTWDRRTEKEKAELAFWRSLSQSL
jgi:hypothetical protein